MSVLFSIVSVLPLNVFRAMGIIATYIDGEDKDAIVSSETPASFTSVHARRQRQFQSLLPLLMKVIGQCLDNGDSSGTSALMDIYETLLVLVSRALPLSTSIQFEHDPRKPRYLASIYPNLFNSSWNVVEIVAMIPTSESLP